MGKGTGTVVYDFRNRVVVADASGNIEWITKNIMVPQSAADNNPLFGSGRDPSFGLFSGFSNSLTTEFAGTFTTLGNNFQNSLNFGPSPPDNLSYSQYHPNVSTLNNGNWYPNLPTNPAHNGEIGNYGPAAPGALAATLVGASGTNWNHSAPLSAVPGGGPLDTGFGPNGLGTAGRIESTTISGYMNSNGLAIPVVNGSFNIANVQLGGTTGLNLNWKYDNGDSVADIFTPQIVYGSGPMLIPLNRDSSVRGTMEHIGGEYVMQLPISLLLDLSIPNSASEGKLGLGSRIGYTDYGQIQFIGMITAVAVPEPTGIVLAAMALLGILLTRRWRVCG